ncbi:MAG: LicD family protein [Massilia sp.]|nr:LicD family protein [Massilia sp.]
MSALDGDEAALTVPPAADAELAARIKQARASGDLRLAEQLAGDGLARFPRSRALWSEAAYNAKRQRDWPLTVTRLNGLHALYRKGAPARAHARLIEALRKDGRTEPALTAARAAWLAHPAHAAIGEQAARTFEQAGQWREAAACLRALLGARDKPAERQFVRLAKALHLAGDDQEALAAIGQARRLYPKSLRWRPFAPCGGAGLLPPTALAQAVQLNQSFCFDSALAGIAALRLEGNAGAGKRELARLEKVFAINAGQYEAGLIAQGRRRERAGALAGIWYAGKNADGDLRIKGVLRGAASEVYIFVNQLFLKSVLVKTIDGVRCFKYTIKRRLAARLPSDPDIRVVSEDGVLLCDDRDALAAHQQVKGGLVGRLQRGFIVTKKGTIRRPMPNNLLLRQRIADYLTRLGEYFFTRFGYRLWLSYGTLLGCIREGDFIFHDDDVDMSYLSTKSSPQEVIEEMVGICKQMVADGWNMRVSVNGIIKPGSGFNMDIYAAWIQDGKLFMQNTTCFPFSREDVEPCRQLEFNGAMAWVPHNAEGFLASKYGANWRVPDPGYQRQMAPGAKEVLALAKPSAAHIDELRALRAAEPA